jgi:lipopolysaccharide transport system ATP-binding protein
MKPIIEVRNLSKKYKIGERQRYLSLRDSVSNLFSRKNTEGSEFWALDDVSFDIHAGESVGIIGRNGAGKSTLLKILSRITPPTKGSVILRGRIASLLEVGTGFHLELTGRENVFMNGSILGLKKREIEAKFDEIVDFSGVEQFIDTPLKHYSSGMQLRLAFAVAAHLEPEILVIDEVLAVGDAEFQKRCLGKMDEVSRSGRTVLFVSHNTRLIASICPKGIFLYNGKILAIGEIEKVTNHYLSLGMMSNPLKRWDITDQAPGNDIVKINEISVVDKNFLCKSEFKSTEPVGLKVKYSVFKPNYILWHGFNLYNSEGINIFDSHSVNLEWYSKPHLVGNFELVSWIPENLLNEGSYFLNFAVFNHDDKVIHLHEKMVVFFNVFDSFFDDNSSPRGVSKGSFPGLVRPLLKWEML